VVLFFDHVFSVAPSLENFSTDALDYIYILLLYADGIKISQIYVMVR